MNDINFAALNWVDYTILGIIAFSMLISIIRGFIREALSLASWILALWVAYTFTNSFTPLFAKYISNPSILYGVVFLSIFIIVLIIGALINFAVGSLVSKTGLSGVDRILGVLFGLARGILLIGIIILMTDQTNLKKEPWWQGSQFVPHFQGLADWLKAVLPNQIKQINGIINRP